MLKLFNGICFVQGLSCPVFVWPVFVCLGFVIVTYFQEMHAGFLKVEPDAPRSVAKKMIVLKQECLIIMSNNLGIKRFFYLHA